jgi:hypothetical protein
MLPSSALFTDDPLPLSEKKVLWYRHRQKKILKQKNESSQMTELQKIVTQQKKNEK